VTNRLFQLMVFGYQVTTTTVICLKKLDGNAPNLHLFFFLFFPNFEKLRFMFGWKPSYCLSNQTK